MVNWSVFLVVAATVGKVSGYEYRYPPKDYVAPYATGSGVEKAFKKARALVQQMTLEEKLNLTIHGNGVPRLGFTGYTSTDGSNGPGTTFSNHSGFENSITLAASLDRDLMYARARLTGEQLRKKGYMQIFGPGGNPSRSPEGGRNPESYGGDPYLVGEGMSTFIRGVQDVGVIATPKHYVGNEQEHARTVSSSNIDDKTFREIYEWPFAESVQAGALAVMCAYNLVNSSYSCADEQTLGTKLKGDLGFQGFIVSDLYADRLGEIGYRAGMDSQLGNSQPLYPPGVYELDGFYLGTNLTTFVKNGSLPMSRVDDAATRIMLPYFAMGQDKMKLPSLPNDIVTQDQKAAGHIRAAGAASAVLLKNTGVLPLKNKSNLALFGLDAGNNPNPNKAGDGFQVAPGVFVPIGESGANINGTLFSAWGAALSPVPYLVAPYDALKAKARENGANFDYVRDGWNLEAVGSVASKPNTICLAFASSASGEETDTFQGNLGDRNNLTAWFNAENVIKTVASKCKNTVVVIHAVGPIEMDWADHENITAIVFAGLPGQETGNSLTDVLYGSYNPSGKLPFTIAQSNDDYPAHVDFSISDYDGKFSDIPYTEGILVDYRWFDAKNIKPRYEFGFGLSYTTFGYGKATAKPMHKPRNVDAKGTSKQVDLFEILMNVKVTVKNTGKVAGHATPQLYLGFPASAGQPPRIMRGFQKSKLLQPQQSQELCFSLRRKDLSYWDVVKQQWVMPKEGITVYIGESSRDIRSQVAL